jgi:hypothetical protein
MSETEWAKHEQPTRQAFVQNKEGITLTDKELMIVI